MDRSAIWEELKDSRTFLRRLKRKAGLAEDFWSSDVEVDRYTTEVISGSILERPATELQRAARFG